MAPKAARFRAKLQQAGKTATGSEVPAKVVANLGSPKRPPAMVTINGYTYRNTVAPMGGMFILGVSAGHREKSGVKAGDVLDVTLELDTEKREVPVPADLKKALANDAKAKATFEGLSFSLRRRYVGSIEGAKAPETRQRRIEKAVAECRAGGPKR